VIGSELVDVEGTFKERFGRTDSGAVLLRPDGYIAWRATALQAGSAEALGNALTSILS
jgi:putative polyketide hydroxylase